MAAVMMAAGAAAVSAEVENETVIVHGDRAEEWDEAVTIDETVQWNGRPTACWAHAKTTAIILPKAPADWSTHTHVRLFMHSAVKTGSGFLLTLSSENPISEGWDYYQARFIVDWEGWKEFLLPISRFGVSRNPLGFNKIQAWSLLGIVAIFAVVPFLSMVTEWNNGIVFPESMRAIEERLRTSQEKQEEIIKMFISQGSLFSSLLIVAELAAVCEELLFRSVIQNALIKLCKNAHVAIIVTAIIFSAFHMDFFGFFPRAILGVMLGYMFWMSGSIIPSMLMHFFNNSTIVVLYYLNTRGFIDIDIDNFGNTSSVLLILLSLIATVAIFIICNRFRLKNDN